MVERLSGDWNLHAASTEVSRNCAVAPSAGAWSRRLVVRRTLAGDRNSQSPHTRCVAQGAYTSGRHTPPQMGDARGLRASNLNRRTWLMPAEALGATAVHLRSPSVLASYGGQPSREFRAKVGGAARIRTGDGGFADLCLTTWLRRQPEVGALVQGGGDWSGKRDSNPRLRPWQGRTLPLSYSRSCRATATTNSSTRPSAPRNPRRTHSRHPAAT